MDQNKSENFVVRIPKILTEKSIRDAIGVGIFYVGHVGKRPKNIPKDDLSTVRIYLSKKEKELFDEAINDFKSKTELIIMALAWVYEQPESIRNTKI